MQIILFGVSFDIDLIFRVGYHPILRNVFDMHYKWNDFNQIIKPRTNNFSNASIHALKFLIIINLFSDCISLPPSFSFLCFPHKKYFPFTSPSQRTIIMVIIIISGHQKSMMGIKIVCSFVCLCNACINGYMDIWKCHAMVPEPCNARE